MRMSALGVILLSVASFAGAAPIVNTDFEPSINVLGALQGQASNGPNPWTSGGAVVVSSGPTLGVQAVNYTSTLLAGEYQHHSRVDLGAVVIPAGWKLRATVDVYLDPSQPLVMTGLSGWANGHADELGFFGGRGDGYVLGRDGVGALWGLLGYISNPPYTGWTNVGLEIEQISANTLKTTYLLGGNVFMHNGFTVTTYTSTVGVLNQVSDISLVTMNMDGTSATATGIYDNYRVELVPEPTAVALLALGGLVVTRRKRR